MFIVVHLLRLIHHFFGLSVRSFFTDKTNRKSLSSLDCRHPNFSRRSIAQRVWGACSPITGNQAARTSICECFIWAGFSNACWWWDERGFLSYRAQASARRRRFTGSKIASNSRPVSARSPWRSTTPVCHLMPVTEISHPHPAVKPTATTDKH